MLYGTPIRVSTVTGYGISEYFTVVNRKRKEGVFQTRATDHLVDAGTMDTNITC